MEGGEGERERGRERESTRERRKRERYDGARECLENKNVHVCHEIF